MSTAMRSRMAVAASVVLLAVGTVVAQQRAAAGNAGADAAIAKARTAYQTAAGAQDGAAIAKLYTPDGIEMPPNAPARLSRRITNSSHRR